MKTDSKDVINRLIFHLIDPTELSGRDALERTQACYRNDVEKTIDDVFKLFDRYEIRINRLEIDLGAVTLDEIPTKLYSALEKELKKYVREKGFRSDISSKMDKQERSIASETSISYDLNNVSVKELSEIKHPFFNFLEYLKNPQIPWYLSSDTSFDIEALARNAFDKSLNDDHYYKQLVSVISQEGRIYKRFAHLAKSDYIDIFIRRYLKINNSSFELIYIDIYIWLDTMLFRNPSHKKEVREWFFECLLYHRPSITQTKNSEFETVVNSLKNELLSHDSTHTGKKAMYRLLQQLGFLPEEELNITSENVFVQYLSRNYKKSIESFQENNLSSEFAQKDTQRFLIYNAGLVIFNPMIPTFFQHLGFLNKESQFKSIHHRVRAVHLLQVLTGLQSKHYDHLLQLNKIICGLDPGFPVDPAFRVTKREKAEATDLLESVLGHWKVMEGTSVGGFQESFVQRNGVVEKSGGDWVVHVENKSIDILMDDLPWGINLLSFPWNGFVVHVEWGR